MLSIIKSILNLPAECNIISLNSDLNIEIKLLPLKRWKIDESMIINLLQQNYHKIPYYSNKDIQILSTKKFKALIIPLDHSKLIEAITLSSFNNSIEPSLHNQKIIVEYSSPNIAKLFHIGHLRSTILGNFLSNLFINFGAEVTKINYLGDWGTQYGKLGVGYEIYGNDEEFKKDPIKHLLDIYVKIHKDLKDPIKRTILETRVDKYTRAMSEYQPEKIKRWKEFRKISINQYKKIYHRLGITFDAWECESQMNDLHHNIIEKLEKKELLKTDEMGRKFVDLNSYNLGVVITEKSNGCSLYVTRDLAAAIIRKEKYNFDKMFYVVANEQTLYFKQLFKILELLGYEWVHNCSHVSFGLIEGISTRKGTAIFLEDILDKSSNIMLTQMKENFKSKYNEISNPCEISNNLGNSAIFIQDLKAHRQKNYIFQWNRMTAFHGHTGPYLNYAYARLCTLEDKNPDIINDNNSINYNLLKEKEIINLVQVLYNYNNRLIRCFNDLSPHHLVRHLLELASKISAMHKNIWVKGQPLELAKARFFIYQCAKKILGHGMKLLGLSLITKM